MPPLAREQRWRTFFDAAVDHIPKIHVYTGFLQKETDAQNARRVVEILRTQMIELRIGLVFIKEHCAYVFTKNHFLISQTFFSQPCEQPSYLV